MGAVDGAQVFCKSGIPSFTAVPSLHLPNASLTASLVTTKCCMECGDQALSPAFEKLVNVVTVNACGVVVLC